MAAVYAADPFVLSADGRYYLYSAGTEPGSFIVRVSDDLLNWSAPKEIYRAPADSWSKDCYWAPECHKINGRYYLFFSANRKDSPALESFAITAVRCDTPDGTFEDYLKRPLFVADYPTIDGNILCEDGHVYLYFSRCCFEHEVDGLEESWIYVVELTPDVTETLGEPKLLLRPEQAWEGRSVPTTRRRWNEGSYILKEDGVYYILYSGNHFLERHYAMGYAVGTDPMGPFVKAEENPIVECFEGVTGTGHGCLVRTPDGLRAVYHGRTEKTTAEATGEDRIALVAPARVEGGKLIIDYRDAKQMRQN